MAGGKHILGKPKGPHIFGTAKVGDRGQIVIPKEARSFFGIEPGDTLLILGDAENGLIVSKPEVLDEVAAQISREKLDANELRGMISAESPDETEVLYISVVNADRKLAKEIANAIVDVAPAQIEAMVEGSTAKKLDYAKSATQCAPNVTNATVIGAVVGMLVAVLAISLQVMLDVRIKDEEDLARICDAPVLGNIPDFNAQGKSGSYAYASEAADRAGGK